MGRNEGAEARLFEPQNETAYRKNIAKGSLALVKRMFGEYVIPDAGGSSPRY